MAKKDSSESAKITESLAQMSLDPKAKFSHSFKQIDMLSREMRDILNRDGDEYGYADLITVIGILQGCLTPTMEEYIRMMPNDQQSTRIN